MANQRGAQTSAYNRLVTVAVAFGSMVSIPNPFHRKHLRTNGLQDVWLLLFHHRKHNRSARLVFLLPPAHRRAARILHYNDLRHRYSEWVVQCRRRSGVSLHHVVRIVLRSKAEHSARRRPRNDRRRVPRWSRCFGDVPSRPRDIRTRYRHSRYCVSHVPLRAIKSLRTRVARRAPRDIPCVRIHAIELARICLLLCDQRKLQLCVAVSSVHAMLPADDAFNPVDLDSAIPEVAYIERKDRGGVEDFAVAETLAR